MITCEYDQQQQPGVDNHPDETIGTETSLDKSAASDSITLSATNVQMTDGDMDIGQPRITNENEDEEMQQQTPIAMTDASPSNHSSSMILCTLDGEPLASPFSSFVDHHTTTSSNQNSPHHFGTNSRHPSAFRSSNLIGNRNVETADGWDSESVMTLRKDDCAQGEDNNNSDHKGVMIYVSVYVKHPYILTLLHFVLALICALFAIPHINMSNPDAGLRLRYHPVAELADGFIAAALELQKNVPTLDTSGFPNLPKSKSRNLQSDEEGHLNDIEANSSSAVDGERRHYTDYMTLIWYSDPDTQILTEERMRVIMEVEERIFNLTSYQNELCKLNYDKSTRSWKCEQFYSAARALMKEMDQTVPFERRVRDLFHQRTYHFPINFGDNDNYVATYIRNSIPFGVPVTGFTSWNTQNSKQQDKFIYETMKKEMLPLVMSLAMTGDQAMNEAKIKMTLSHSTVMSEEIMVAMMRDMSLAVFSVVCIFSFVLVHTGSLFVAIGALGQILISFPMALFIYRMILGIKLFGGLHILAIFLVLGIGIDDCFVFFDAFDQVTRENPDRSQEYRMNRAFCMALSAISTTTVTTCVVFLSLVTCPIPALLYFGVYCSLLIGINFILAMTLFTGILLIWDSKFRRSDYFCGLRSRCRRLWGGCCPSSSEAIHHSRSESVTSQLMRRLSITQSFDTSLTMSTASSASTYIESGFAWLGTRVITHPIGRAIILMFSAAMIGFLVYNAFLLGPSKEIDSIWREGHPFYMYEKLSGRGFYGEHSYTASVRFVNGLKQPFRYGMDITDNNDFGKPIYDPTFDPLNPTAMAFIINQCDHIRSKLGVIPELSSYNNQSMCPLNEFRDWLLARGLRLPIQNRTLLQGYLLKYYAANRYKIRGIILVDEGLGGLPVPKIIFNEFPTTRSQRADYYEERRTLWDAWSQFSYNGPPIPFLGSDASRAPVDGFYEVWMTTQEILVSSAKSSISSSIGISFALLFISTRGDLLPSIVACLCLAGSAVCTLGVMYLAGWSLGAVEAIASIIMCGIAEDYCMHMAIAYSESGMVVSKRNRRLRSAHTLGHVGVSVLFAAFTMLAASGILLLCTLSVLYRFGQFLLIVIVFSLFHAIFLSNAILSLPIHWEPIFLSDKFISCYKRTGTCFARLGSCMFNCLVPPYFRHKKRKTSSPCAVLYQRCSRRIVDLTFFIVYLLFLLGLSGGALYVGLQQPIKL